MKVFREPLIAARRSFSRGEFYIASGRCKMIALTPEVNNPISPSTVKEEA
jgi:hypothetical protein